MTKLPKPDEYGNYWLNSDHKLGPAIFPSKRRTYEGEVRRLDSYFVLVGTERGFLFKGNTLEQFKTPQEALEAIQAQGKPGCQ